MSDDIETRWLMRVECQGHGGCWRWIGAIGEAPHNDYGRFYNPVTQRMCAAHRWGYEHYRAPVPEGWDVDHLCRNHWCVNPEHLEAVPHGENVRRGIAGEVNRRRIQALTHCKNGHEWTAENTYHRTNVLGRSCRPCSRAANHRYQERLRAKQIGG